MVNFHLTILIPVIFILARLRGVHGRDLWDNKWRGTLEQCPRSGENYYTNLPLISAAYCFNNNTGLCKLVAGRFEFYFDHWQNKILGPVEQSQYVDQYGYHKRMPISYDPNGKINYVDRSIMWASQYVKEIPKRSLLSSTDINWCLYAGNAYWPYKSAMIDPSGKYNIYFFNRQTCVEPRENSDKKQHFNTRFLHNSTCRIDLDINPLIFSIQDNTRNNELRLVKHHRQHWYTTNYQVLEGVGQHNFFVLMGSHMDRPSRINETSGPFIGRQAYRPLTDICIYGPHMYEWTHNNIELVQVDRGTDQYEVVDLPQPHVARRNDLPLEVNLHNIPIHNIAATQFAGISAADYEKWKTFAADGFTWTALTTIPTNPDQPDNENVRAFMLWSNYYVRPSNEYDENYPMPQLSIFNAGYKNGTWADASRARLSEANEIKNLNYVDDIAYLYQCRTILVIFGPLYTEIPPDQFSIDTKTKIGSILDLDLWELTNAFFSPPGTSQIYFFHRTNYVSQHDYECGSGPDSLVTAKIQSNKYACVTNSGYQYLKGQHFSVTEDQNHFEETFFKDLEIFQGDDSSPRPDDPRNYKIEYVKIPEPLPGEDFPTWMYILIGIAVLMLLLMCVACLMTFRRRKRHVHHLRTHATARSSLPKSFNSTATARSGLPTNRSPSQASIRSGLASPTGSNKSSTKRSRKLSSSASGKTKTARSPSLSRSAGFAATTRSGALFKRSPSSSGTPKSSSGSTSKGSKKLAS